MLIVKPILDKKVQEELGNLCGVKFNPDALAFSAYDNDVFVGFCQFTVCGGVATATDFRSVGDLADFEAMFIMSRGALNYIDLCGFHYAKCLHTAGNITLLKAIGFRETDSDFLEMDLAKEFTSGCDSCH